MTTARKHLSDKRDRLRQLRAFCHAARLRSITRGARHLGLSQPAVSLHVRDLQNELEAELLDRSSRPFSLTRAGETLYEIAMPLVRALDAMPGSLFRGLDKLDSGELRIAAGTVAATYFLPPFLKRFHEEHPDLTLRLMRTPAREGLELLATGGADLLVTTRWADTDGFLYHPVFSCPLVLIVPRDHPLAGRESVGLEEASVWPAIVPPRGAYGRHPGETLGDRFAAAAGDAMEVPGWDLIKEYVAAGLGVAVVPRLCVVEKDPVLAIPFREDAPCDGYGVFVARDKPLTPQAGRLVEMMAPDFRHPLTGTA